MAKILSTNENFSLNYHCPTVMDCNINFENPEDDSIVIHRLNIWLQAIGRNNIVVEPKSSPKKGL